MSRSPLRWLVYCCSIPVLFVWTALIWLLIAFRPSVIDGWMAAQINPTAWQRWCNDAASWLRGDAHPNQVIPGLIFLGVPLALLTLGLLGAIFKMRGGNVAAPGG